MGFKNNIWYKEQTLPSSILTSLTIWQKYKNFWLLGRRPVTMIRVLGNLYWIGLLSLKLLVPQTMVCYILYGSWKWYIINPPNHVFCAISSNAKIKEHYKKYYTKHHYALTLLLLNLQLQLWMGYYRKYRFDDSWEIIKLLNYS